MICPECNGEMTKKWQPQRAAKVPSMTAALWACGVCGCQLTQAEIKLQKLSQKAPAPSILISS